MNRYYYDLHMHSCLSPCADDDNTPNNLAGMAAVSELDIIALTDHNSVKNCPAFFEAARRYGIIPIAGMELTTSEDVHMICLFAELNEAMRFGGLVDSRRMKIKNRPDIFGNQLVLDSSDNVIETEPDLLSVATDISVDSLPDLVKQYGGICYPAHIDRESNGIISVLGTLPEHPHFNTVEINNPDKSAVYTEKYGLSDRNIVFNSDAHMLGSVNDRAHYIELFAENGDESLVVKELLERLG